MTLYYSLVSLNPPRYRCKQTRPIPLGSTESKDTHPPYRVLTFPKQVFLLLVAEMVLFMLLIVPLPFTIRRKMFTFMCAQPTLLPFGHPLTTLQKRKSSNSEITIWNEDNLHLYSDPLYR
jgi:hypothetical protein